MARGINKVFLIGNLGQDPDARSTSSGTQVVTLNLATDESYKDRSSGQMVPKTEWHRVVLFGRTAEVAAQYLKKGSKIYIEGKLQTRKWQDKNGQDRYTTETVVDISGQMQMLDGGTNTNPPEPENSQEAAYIADQLKSESSVSRQALPESIPSNQTVSDDAFGHQDSDKFDDDIPF